MLKLTRENINATTFKESGFNAPMEIELEIGDVKQSEFYPQVKTKHWGNECNFSMRFKDSEVGTPIVSQKNGKIEWEKNNVKARFYELETQDQFGAYEFEIEFAEKPLSNVVEYTIQTKGLNFFYQPELTEEEITNGERRPENVVGSYAVYHQTKKDNKVGDVPYLTGKAFHIYRPFAEDSKGNKVWCDLRIDEQNELLTITIPQSFLDSAKYPVIVDPTLGYTSIGATAHSGDGVGAATGAFFTGIVTSVHVAMAGGTTFTNDSGAQNIWRDAGGVPVIASQFGEIVRAPFTVFVNATPAFFTYTLPGPKKILQDYIWIGAIVSEGTGTATPNIYYDVGAGTGAFRNDLGTWTANTNIVSSYVTYTDWLGDNLGFHTRAKLGSGNRPAQFTPGRAR